MGPDARATASADCGGTFHPVAMHFDHRPGVEKKFEIGFGVRRYSRQKILAEKQSGA
jgi:hypothetical protein